jgi:hypothetical protein
MGDAENFQKKAADVKRIYLFYARIKLRASAGEIFLAGARPQLDNLIEAMAVFKKTTRDFKNAGFFLRICERDIYIFKLTTAGRVPRRRPCK